MKINQLCTKVFQQISAHFCDKQKKIIKAAIKLYVSFFFSAFLDPFLPPFRTFCYFDCHKSNNPFFSPEASEIDPIIWINFLRT